MGYILSTESAELLEAFLAAEEGTTSAQGFAKLKDMTRRVLSWFDGEELPLAEVGIADATRYEAYLSTRLAKDGKPIQAGTMRNYLKTARRLFDFLVMTERIASNPFLELRYPRLPEHLSRNLLSEAQMGRLLRELGRFDELPTEAGRLRRYRVHVVAEFLYASGLRIAEAASLVEANLDLPRRLVHVPEGKGGRPRTAFLTSYAAEIMGLYLARGRALVLGKHPRGHGETLFGADKSRLAAVVNAELRTVCTALELPVITSHGFRHSLGTHLLRSGCDMRHIQAILGHEALQTTQVYTRVDKDDLKRSLDEHHPRQWGKEKP